MSSIKRRWPEWGLEITESAAGLIVTQAHRSYLAKEWRLSPQVIAAINTALANGFTSLLQNGHPKGSHLLPDGPGVAYLSFARDFQDPWCFAFDDRCSPRRTQGREISMVLFNRSHAGELEGGRIPFEVETRSASNLLVDMEWFEPALQCVKSATRVAALALARG